MAASSVIKLIMCVWLLKALLGDFSHMRQHELIPVCVMSVITVCETFMLKAGKVVRFLRVVSTNLKFKYTLRMYLSGTLCDNAPPFCR